MPGMPPGGPSYTRLEQVLGENVRERDVDLKDGRVPDDIDLLLLLAPKDLDEKQRFALDQYLMRGGPVVVATSPYEASIGNGGIKATKQRSGLEDWLGHFGVSIEDTMVVDPRSAALPVPVERMVGGMALREIRMLPYPHFADLRGDSLNPASPITRSLQQLTLNWASPVVVEASKAKGLKVTELLRSSPGSRTSRDAQLVPDLRGQPPLGFKLDAGEAKPRVLAVALEGRFESAFKGKASPLLAAASAPAGAASAAAAAASAPETGPTTVIEHSPGNARFVLVASNGFATDTAIDLASRGLGTLYTKPLEFLQNTIDWALEDPALLALRGRTQLARTLEPLPEQGQRAWEIGNYAIALAGLGFVWAWRRRVAHADKARQQRILALV
jgi:ABC-2 type transport system permease protein